MCSLSYIPQGNGFILSHNRDELPQRKSSSNLERLSVAQREIVFPKDLQAGGTWMGADNRGLSACILNGGSVSYLRQVPYRASRGSVIPHLLETGNIEDFKKKWSSEGIEPFTLIIAQGKDLWQFIHDPGQDSWTHLDPDQAHFWSSTKLYHPEIRAARAKRFNNWLESYPMTSAESISEFHLSEQQGELKGGLVLPEHFPLSTVSFCQFQSSPGKQRFQYEYLLKGSSDLHDW